MCEAGVTNAEPPEDNSISAVKVGQIAIGLAMTGLDRMQLVGCTSNPLSLPESLTMDSPIVIKISSRALHGKLPRNETIAEKSPLTRSTRKYRRKRKIIHSRKSHSCACQECS